MPAPGGTTIAVAPDAVVDEKKSLDPGSSYGSESQASASSVSSASSGSVASSSSSSSISIAGASAGEDGAREAELKPTLSKDSVGRTAAESADAEPGHTAAQDSPEAHRETRVGDDGPPVDASAQSAELRALSKRRSDFRVSVSFEGGGILMGDVPQLRPADSFEARPTTPRRCCRCCRRCTDLALCRWLGRLCGRADDVRDGGVIHRMGSGIFFERMHSIASLLSFGSAGTVGSALPSREHVDRSELKPASQWQSFRVKFGSANSVSSLGSDASKRSPSSPMRSPKGPETIAHAAHDHHQHQEHHHHALIEKIRFLVHTHVGSKLPSPYFIMLWLSRIIPVLGLLAAMIWTAHGIYVNMQYLEGNCTIENMPDTFTLTGDSEKIVHGMYTIRRAFPPSVEQPEGAVLQPCKVEVPCYSVDLGDSQASDDDSCVGFETWAWQQKITCYFHQDDAYGTKGETLYCLDKPVDLEQPVFGCITGVVVILFSACVSALLTYRRREMEQHKKLRMQEELEFEQEVAAAKETIAKAEADEAEAKREAYKKSLFAEDASSHAFFSERAASEGDEDPNFLRYMKSQQSMVLSRAGSMKSMKSATPSQRMMRQGSMTSTAMSFDVVAPRSSFAQTFRPSQRKF